MAEENVEDCKKDETLQEEIVQEEEKKENAKKEEEEDFKNKYYYLLAEMDNTRKRYEREKESLIRYGNDRILKDLLEVIDNFDRTLTALCNEQDDKTKNIVSGISMIKKQFTDVLGRFGLIPLDTNGKLFDPNYHEAMAQVEVEGTQGQEIVNEYLKGYMLNGRLLRAAKVVVSKIKE